MRQRLVAARSFLFVPGDRPERFAKAEVSGADVVVLDLEDAVAPARKEEARGAVLNWLKSGHDAVVRVNSGLSPWHRADISAVGDVAPALMIPKAESVDDLAAAIGYLVVPLVETAHGVMTVESLLRFPGVVRPAFGSLDLALDIGVDPDDHDALRWARSCLVMAAASAGTGPPIDGITARFQDEEALALDVREALRLGIPGKLCVHPAQVEPLHRLLRPTEDDLARARQIVSAATEGVVAVNGSMVDAPVLRRALALLERGRS